MYSKARDQFAKARIIRPPRLSSSISLGPWLSSSIPAPPLCERGSHRPFQRRRCVSSLASSTRQGSHCPSGQSSRVPYGQPHLLGPVGVSAPAGNLPPSGSASRLSQRAAAVGQRALAGCARALLSKGIPGPARSSAPPLVIRAGLRLVAGRALLQPAGRRPVRQPVHARSSTCAGLVVGRRCARRHALGFLSAGGAPAATRWAFLSEGRCDRSHDACPG